MSVRTKTTFMGTREAALAHELGLPVHKLADLLPPKEAA